MSRIRIIAAATSAGVLALALAGGETYARAQINARLESAGADLGLTYAGTSALVALATRELDVAATVDADRLADLVGERLAARSGVDVAEVSLEDGLVAVTLEIGARGLQATAWLDIAPATSGLNATVVSIEAGGIQVPPAMAFGDATTFAIELPLPDDCPTPQARSVDIDPSGLRIVVTIGPDTLTCLAKEDS